MKFPYHVFHNGVSYAPFTDVPIEEETTTAVEEDEKVEEVAEETLPFADESELEENSTPEITFGAPKTEKKYTKTDIYRMNIDNLRNLARESGIRGYTKKKGADLKEELLQKFGL